MEDEPRRLGKGIHTKKVAITYRACVLTEMWANFLSTSPKKSILVHYFETFLHSPRLWERTQILIFLPIVGVGCLFFEQVFSTGFSRLRAMWCASEPTLLAGKGLPLNFLKSNLQTPLPAQQSYRSSLVKSVVVCLIAFTFIVNCWHCWTYEKIIMTMVLVIFKLLYEYTFLKWQH